MARRPPTSADPAASMSLGEHLDDLRKRLFFAIIPLIPLVLAAWTVRQWTMGALLAPIKSALLKARLPVVLQATGPLESLLSDLKVSFIIALLLAGPWCLFQLWKFVAPGLYGHERRFVYLLTPLSVILTAAGLLFMYFIMLPLVLGFALSFAREIPGPAPMVAPLPEGVVLPGVPVLEADPPDPPLGATWVNRPLMVQKVCVANDGAGHTEVLQATLGTGALVQQQYRLSEYIGLITNMSLAFGLSFQLPVVILLLGWAGIITPKVLGKYRRHAVFACVLLGAFISPTGEPIASTILAVPLYLLYELGMFLLKVLPAARVAGPRRGGDATDPDDAAEGP